MFKVSFFIAVLFVNFTGILSLQCYKCQSDEDEGCAIADLEHVISWDHETCEEGVEECAMWINNDDPVTYRGCKPNFSVHLIETCKIDFCNHELFPKNRAQCYQCDDCPEINEKLSKKPCVNYDANEKCFTIVFGEEHVPFTSFDVETTYRGCSSDVNTTGIDFCSNEEFSKYCIKEDENDQDSYDRSFGCVTCSKNASCYNQNSIQQCTPLLLGREPDKCYTIVKPEFIQRGCLKKYGNTLSCNVAEDCHVCLTHGCNSKVYQGIECHKCDSRINDQCETDPKKTGTGYCISEDKV